MMAQLLNELPRFFTIYNLVFLLQAAGATVALSALGSIIGLLLGALLCLVRLSDASSLILLRGLAVLFTEFFRRVPFLVTLMLIFFVFQLSGADLPLFVIAAISVTLIASAFLAEIIRAGLLSIHRNQWDAATAMNFSLVDSIRYVVLPQAWKMILPPAFSFFVLFIKDTALASQIGVIELTYAGKVLNNKGFSAVLVFGTILVLYFAVSYPLSLYGQYLEKRLAPPRS